MWGEEIYDTYKEKNHSLFQFNQIVFFIYHACMFLFSLRQWEVVGSIFNFSKFEIEIYMMDTSFQLSYLVDARGSIILLDLMTIFHISYTIYTLLKYPY